MSGFHVHKTACLPHEDGNIAFPVNISYLY